MSFMNKMSTFFGLEDDEYMEEEKHVASKPVVHQPVQRPVQQPVKQTQAKVQPVPDLVLHRDLLRPRETGQGKNQA